MDIAEEARETWLIEDDPLHAARRIHPEIEFLPVAKRENVVKHLVVIGKLDRRTGPHRQNERREREVPLVEHHFRLGTHRRPAGLEPDDRVLNWSALNLCSS